MSRTGLLRRAARAMTLAATIVAGAGCQWAVGTEYPVGYAYEYPPDDYVVTTEPVYYGGHATYWWGSSWYYRSGDHWQRYDREPPELHQRRMEAPPARRMYEPSRGRPAERAGHPDRRSPEQGHPTGPPGHGHTTPAERGPGGHR